MIRTTKRILATTAPAKTEGHPVTGENPDHGQRKGEVDQSDARRLPATNFHSRSEQQVGERRDDRQRDEDRGDKGETSW